MGCEFLFGNNDVIAIEYSLPWIISAAGVVYKVPGCRAGVATLSPPVRSADRHSYVFQCGQHIPLFFV